jgi:hypothetical protein
MLEDYSWARMKYQHERMHFSASTQIKKVSQAHTHFTTATMLLDGKRGASVRAAMHADAMGL